MRNMFVSYVVMLDDGQVRHLNTEIETPAISSIDDIEAIETSIVDRYGENGKDVLFVSVTGWKRFDDAVTED